MTMQQPTEIQLHQVLNMLSRRRRLILAIGILGAALGVAIAMLLPAKYTAKAQILIGSQQVSPISGRTNLTETVDESDIATQVTILASRHHLRRVRDSLLERPELQAVRTQSDREAIRRANAAEEVKDPRATEVEMLSLDELEKGLVVYKERMSRVIAITFTSTSPEVAAVIANQVARLHVAMYADRIRAEKSSAIVEREIADLSHQLSIVKSDLGRRRALLISLRDLRRGREGDRHELIEAINSPLLTDFSRMRIDLLRSRDELTSKFAEAHPKVRSVVAKLQELRQKSDREVDRLVTQLESEKQIADARERSLLQRIRTLQTARVMERDAEFGLRSAKIEAISIAQPINSLLRRQQREMTEHPEIAPGMRILTVADSPIEPSSTNPILFVLPAMIAFVIFGGVLATVLELLDRGLRSEHDIKDALGISCIGLVPQLRQLRQSRLRGSWFIPSGIPMYQYLLHNPFAAYTEAIRSIVTATLQVITPNRSPKVILITSSVQGEGKTTLAVSFAVYVASLQQRVILVDFDFRPPTLQRKHENRVGTGMVDVLQAHSLKAAIKHIPELALDYLPLPGHPIDPVALLGGNQLTDLLDQLRKDYDCVVIDSGPLLGTTEARLLTTMCDKVLFVVKWGSTRKEVAQNALNLLRDPYVPERDPANFVNAVITQVDLKKHAHYRHGDVCEVLARKKRYFSRPAGLVLLGDRRGTTALGKPVAEGVNDDNPSPLHEVAFRAELAAPLGRQGTDGDLTADRQRMASQAEGTRGVARNA